ncbi:hypothetical protein [Microcoleus sp. D2_18a_B4]|uniref:hypothetical protein n=1 Tax=Microcoleus sp. D2_18a_B4 TaxID=3055329 RepID=UPI002FD0CC9D
MKNSPKGESSLGHPQAIIIKMPSRALPETGADRPIVEYPTIRGKAPAKHNY